MQLFLIDQIKYIQYIQDIAYQTWQQAYSKILSQEQIEYMLDFFYDTNVLTKNFETKEEFFYLILNENDYIGFIGISYFPLQTIKINKFYILPQFQKNKNGTKIFQQLLIELKLQQNDKIILNVNRFNENAIHFYFKQGFTVLKEENNDIGNGFWMNDYVLIKTIKN